MIETWSTRPNRPRLSRRDELLSVAADLFAERGFAKVTVDDIGNAVGVSGPALYHHFDGKESLLGEMLVRISDSLLTKATAIVDNVSLHKALDPIIAMHVDFAVDNRSLITVHFRDLVQARKADQQRVKDLQSAYVDIWVDIVAAQHIPVLDTKEVRVAVHAVLGLINSTPFSGRLRRDVHVSLLRTMAAGAIAGFLAEQPDELTGPQIGPVDSGPVGDEDVVGFERGLARVAAELELSELVAVDLVGSVSEAEQPSLSRMPRQGRSRCWCQLAPKAWMAQSTTLHAMLGAAILIIAISRRASRFPTVSIKWAVFNVSSRVCSMAMRDSAIRSKVTVCSETGRPNVTRCEVRRHIISRARSASPISRMQWWMRPGPRRP